MMTSSISNGISATFGYCEPGPPRRIVLRIACANGVAGVAVSVAVAVSVGVNVAVGVVVSVAVGRSVAVRLAVTVGVWLGSGVSVLMASATPVPSVTTPATSVVAGGVAVAFILVSIAVITSATINPTVITPASTTNHRGNTLDFFPTLAAGTACCSEGVITVGTSGIAGVL